MQFLNQFIVGDNAELIKNIQNNTIDLTITSPPYKDSDNYQSIDFNYLFTELYRVHKNNTLFFLNFGHLTEEKARPFKVLFKALEAGWQLNDTIIWTKTQYSPIQGKRRLNNLTEFIFMLYKGKMPEIDRLSIGIPYTDKSNIGRYSKQDLKCRGNNWIIPYETINKKDDKFHNDRFPLALPEMCIKLSGLKGGIVLDIFGGSGTTVIAAEKLGFNFVAFEKNPYYKEIYKLKKQKYGTHNA